MSYAFISYSSKNQNESDQIRAIFKRNGIHCWMAPYDIPAGSKYAHVINDALENCACFVLVLTNDSQNSQYVEKEVERAVAYKKPVITMQLEDVVLNSGFKYYIGEGQIVPVRDIDEKSPGMIKVINGLRAFGVSAENDYAETNDKKSKPYSDTNSLEKENEKEKEKGKGKEKGNKKSIPYKIIIPAAIAVIALVILIVAFVAGGDSDDKPSGGSQSSSQMNEAADNESVNITMSDELFDFTFELEGKVYKLPLAYNVLADDGWTISTSGYSDETVIGGNSYESFHMVKNGKKAYIEVYNYSGNAKAVKECMIGGIECDLTSDIQFTIAKGITCRSAAEEVLSAFGTPAYNNEGDGYTSIKYESAGDSDSRVSFLCYNDESMSKYSAIKLRNFIATENDKTVTNEETPEYLSAYQSPLALGNDIYSGIFMMEGDLYKLPAPVSVFVENGWKIVEQSGPVVSGGTDQIAISKNGKKIYAYVTNFAEYQTTVENCAVSKVNIYDTDNIKIVIPGEITIGSDYNDVKNAITDDFSYFKGFESYQYDYYEYEPRDFSIGVSVNIATEKVDSIDIGCKTWDSAD